MTVDKDRLRRWVREGKLKAGEAAGIAHALERLDRDRTEAEPRSVSRKRRSPAGELKARYLRGEIDEDGLRRGFKRLAVFMALAFGVFMAVFGSLTDARSVYADGGFLGALATLPTAALGGAVFGWLMHRLFLAPMVSKLVALQSAVDLGREPLELTRPGQCPTCGAEHARTWGPFHPVMLHWFLNPGLALNELAFGQRIPRESHQCLECGTSFIDCASCKTSVDALDWSIRSQFGQWGGMHCVRCGGEIPVMRNGLALLIEAPVRLVRRVP